MNEPPFDNLQVRQALKAVVDPDEMLAVAVQGHGAIACNNPVRPNDRYYLPQDCPQDIDRAISLLAEAGYADGLELELVSSTSSAPWMAIVTAYKEEAAVAGIDVTIKMALADGYWSEVWLRVPFSMSEWGWRAAEQVLNEMFRCGGG